MLQRRCARFSAGRAPNVTIKHLIPFIPKTWGKYYEPFLGGGAMFFYLGPTSAEISDASGPLIETYKAVQERPKTF